MSNQDPKNRRPPAPGEGQPGGESAPLLKPRPLRPDVQAEAPEHEHLVVLANPKGSFYDNGIARWTEDRVPKTIHRWKIASILALLLGFLAAGLYFLLVR